jgi:hypothetical protein
MVTLASVVDVDALLEVLWTSTLAGLGVTAIYAIAIVGVTRAADFSRDGRPVEAVVFGVLGALAFAVVCGSVVFGIVVMTSK